MTELFDTLKRSGLSDAAARALANIPHKVVRVETRRPFRDYGHERNEVMFVKSGLIAKFKPDGNGRRQIVSLRFPGEGLLPSPSMGPAPYGIQAITTAEVLVGKAEDLDAIIDKHPEIARLFYTLVQQQEEIGYEWLVSNGRRDSLARVAHLLCETAQRMHVKFEEGPLHNPFTQQQIADITGQTSVNVNRVFAELERRGIIRREGRKIFADEPEDLRQIGSFHPGYLHQSKKQEPVS
ncbi:Crp/Fnr family transcriptional regulator [Sphingomicrobium clamense]|uniref:Crp/Fnr family transcriptional regulator n=1 Tax=Sphingomicrobium clamense TaxID=2851013 RepID=A0ABS6V6P6_9SPHN|nr:Crp/Fnr family transcriptional regulator [Sphingomicrobium sp. B8]MBW0145244.1 Crp/Fnr family transcriptional regulator [Sphingomicrobium sp. B8]